MKFIVSSQSLLRGLQAVNGVISSNNALPILDDFLFELEGNALKVKASDLETTITATIDTIKAEEEGSVAIPAKIMMDLLKTYGDTPLLFQINGTAVEMTVDEAKFKISGHNADEFPNSPMVDNPTKVNLNAELINTAISKTLFATANDDLRPAMSGVYCDLSSDSIIFVATDAHKLVRYKRTDGSTPQSATFILPKKPLNILRNILPTDPETPVEISYNEANAHFKFENIDMIGRLVDGKYPNYEAVIPANNPNVLIVDRHAFITTLKRASFFANKSTNQIRLTISGQELVVDAEDIDYSTESRQRLSCNYSGEDMVIGFNSRFLLEMLQNIDSENIRLEMSAPNRAGILKPVEVENEAEDILMLVMPVMLNT